MSKIIIKTLLVCLVEKKTETINGKLIRIKSENDYVLVLMADCSSDTFVLVYVQVWMIMKTKRKHATESLITIYLQDAAKLQLRVLELSDFSRGDF